MTSTSLQIRLAKGLVEISQPDCGEFQKPFEEVLRLVGLIGAL